MKNKQTLLAVTAAIVIICGRIEAQESSTVGAGQNTQSVSAEDLQNAMLARSSAEYRVTPGDIYTLGYAAGTTMVTYIITVDSSYRIKVSNLGVINGAGKTFMQLKQEVEGVVSNNYPLSGVQLALTEAAVFRVYVKGEVVSAGEVSAWGLSRLSSLIPAADNETSTATGRQISTVTGRQTSTATDSQTGGNSQINSSRQKELTRLASLRDIEIRSSNGTVKVYDLYRARRYGELNQDPYLRPGDVVTFKRLNREVSISGAVERPGLYQLLTGEHLKELVEQYGGGFTPIADSSRIEMIRYVGAVSGSGDKIRLTQESVAEDYELKHYDEVIVPDIASMRPVIFVEGAVRAVIAESVLEEQGFQATTTSASVTASNRLVVQFNHGEDYAALIRRNKGWFLAVSDPGNAYLIRDGNRIAVNLNPMLYDTEYRSVLDVREYDTLVVPFRQYFVSVAGAVAAPGRYPYIPDRDWEYYIGLAGGFVQEKNALQAVEIRDMNGTKQAKETMIGPESTITARTNNFLYYFNQFAPPIMTVLSIVSTFLSVWLTINR